ncbi:hypothetical protein E4U14_006044 [Claviceps sp. LM454 group G7]|nr:hypothetical protein E4U14_006044 [Claviceps sp. LM454 group G7]
MIDPYFATINSKFTIWDKSKFQAMVDSIRVPRHYLNMLEQLFTHTARCAEATGILQWRRIRGRLRESGFQEYNELAHCLYILDKKGCRTAGVPPRIPAEVQLNLAAQYTDKVLEALALSSVEPKTKFGNPLRQYGSSLEIAKSNVEDATKTQTEHYPAKSRTGISSLVCDISPHVSP